MLIKKKRIPISKIMTVGLLPSFLKKGFYRLKGMKFGKNVSIAIGSILIGKKVEIGEGTNIGFGTLIRGKNIKIGKRVDIGSLVYMEAHNIDIDDDAKIREQVQVGGIDLADAAFKLGKRSHIRQGCFINPSMPVEIGNDTAIGGRSLIFTHSTWQSALDGYPCTFAPVTIGDNVWISWDVFILPGVSVGDGSLIAAGSVVTRNIPEKCLASGNPARIVIPSGSYPRGLDAAERSQLVVKILDEFWRYMERYQYQVNKEQLGEVLLVEIKSAMRRRFQKNPVFRFYYVEKSDPNLKDLDLDSLTTVLSMNPLSDRLRVELQKKGAMWADLTSRECRGANSFGEELLKFLGHHGVRFVRIDV